MKQLIIFVLMGISTYSFGQAEKGSFMIGGAIYGDFSNQKPDYNSSIINTFDYTLAFKPNIGYFIINNLSVNIIPKIVISNSTSKYNDREDQYTQITEFGLQLNTRNYFGNNKIRPFVSIGLGIDKSYIKYNLRYRTEGDIEWISREVYNFYLNFETNFIGGIAIFVNDNISIDLLLDYSYKFTKIGSADESVVSDIDKYKKSRLYFGSGITILI